MRIKLIISIIILLVTTLIFTSCRSEEREFIQADEDEILVGDSNIATLVKRTTSNDGSKDNIVDRANCFDIIFPYSVNVNSQIILLTSEANFADVECVFDQSDDDVDTLEIIYPITIRLEDFTEIEIDNNPQLSTYIANCNGENIADEDIECIDFEFPIEARIFNINNELLETVDLTTDKQLYEFVVNINDSDVVTLDFPLNVVLNDGTETNVNTITALETELINAINICDEDDDFDYNEDDCDNCTLSDIASLMTSCSDWNVNILRRDNNTNYDDEYDTYEFNFFNDGTMSVFWNTTTVTGTWIGSGTGNNIEVIINVPALPLCNNNWILREVKNCSEFTEIDFRLGVDRIQYIRNCN